MTVQPENESQRTTDELRSNEASSLLLARRESESEHLVQFYETDAHLIEMLVDFIETGLSREETCLLFVTSEHLVQLEQHVQTRSLDLPFLRAQGACYTFEADELLAQVTVDGMPERERFTAVVGSLVAQAAHGGRRIRLVGEMVVQLWTRGNPEATIRLEELWNELRQTAPPFSLLCVYPMQIFAREEYQEPFSTICQQHSHVLPSESYSARASVKEHLRAITLLQQKAASLEAEIEERREAEKRLLISEQRYRRLFEASTDGLLIADPDSGTITDANPCITKLLGYAHEELLGQELWHIGLFPDQQAYREAVRQFLDQQIIRPEELVLQARDGQFHPVELLGTLYQANGHPVIQWTIRDLADRKRAEEARLYLAAIVESSVDAILSKDLDGTITSWNSGAERMYGYRAQEIVGQPVTRLFPLDRQEEFQRIMERIQRGELVEHYETTRVRKDGTRLNVSVTVSPIKESNGTIIGASAIARDITERKELEQQREAFTSLVTHELRTPLTALQGNVQLAQRWLIRLLSQQEQAGAEQQRTLEEVLTMLGRSQQQLRIQNRLINDLLDASRLREGKLELYQAPCDLLELVYETVQDYQAAYPSRLLTLTLPENDLLPVYADGDRLRQVLGNYLTNALKFAPSSEPVRIGLTLEAEVVRVWVADQGPGLSPEQCQHIWERFAQAPQTPVQSGWKVGLGLGLYLCQQLMSRQQGQVGVESTKGKGATFWFTLPLLASLPRD